jgi:hypothetical protein
VSTSDAGVKGDLDSVEPILSAAGTTVAFTSIATNLDPADPSDGFADVYVKDWTGGNLSDIELDSTSNAGVKGNASSATPFLAAGRVAFVSYATNLDPLDGDAMPDVYVKELGTTANHPAVADDDAYTRPSTGTLVVPAPGVLTNDSDTDGDGLTATLIAAPGHGSVSLTPDGGFTYVAAPGFTGTDSFTYAANDGSADSNVATVTIRGNARPVAAGDAYSTDQGVDLSVPAPGVLGNDADADGDALTARVTGFPGQGALSLSADGSFLYQPGSGFSGNDAFTYVANDGVEDSVPTTVTIIVNPPPACTGVCLTVDDVAVAEGNRGSTRALFTIRLSAPTRSRVTVLVDTADGTAVATSDYQGIVAKLVTLKRGETTATVAVNIKGDRLREPDESFFLRLSVPVNAHIADAQGIGTIVNDD